MNQKGTLTYYSNNYVYFNVGELVYRSTNTYDLKTTHDICFEWKIFGLRPEPQPRIKLAEIIETLQHPVNCVLDVDATFSLLKYRVICKSRIYHETPT